MLREMEHWRIYRDQNIVYPLCFSLKSPRFSLVSSVLYAIWWSDKSWDSGITFLILSCHIQLAVHLGLEGDWSLKRRQSVPLCFPIFEPCIPFGFIRILSRTLICSPKLTVTIGVLSCSMQGNIYIYQVEKMVFIFRKLKPTWWDKCSMN